MESKHTGLPASSTSLKRLDPIQNQAIRTATGAFRASPKVSLEVLSGIKRLELSRKQKLTDYTVRAFANPSNPVRKILESLNTYAELPPEALTKLQQQSVRKRIRDVMATLPSWPRKYMGRRANWLCPLAAKWHRPLWRYDKKCQDLYSRTDTKYANRHHISVTHDSDNMIAYTDGSKTNDGVAFSMVAKPPNQPVVTKSFRIDDSTSS